MVVIAGPAQADEAEQNQIAIDAGRKLRQIEWTRSKCGVDVPKDEVVKLVSAVLANTTWGRHGYEMEQQALAGMERNHGLDVVCAALKTAKP